MCLSYMHCKANAIAGLRGHTDRCTGAVVLFSPHFTQGLSKQAAGWCATFGCRKPGLVRESVDPIAGADQIQSP